METSYYLITQIGFVLITLIFYGLTLRELKKGLAATAFSEARKTKVFTITIIVLMTWMVVISTLSIRGFFLDFGGFPPKIGMVLIAPLVLIPVFTLSQTAKEIVTHIPPQNLIRLQGFRVWVEVLLWILLIQELLPKQMSFEGLNFDVLTGLSAPVVAYLVGKNRIGKKATIFWNILGLVLLFNIVAIALLSMPTPFRIFMNEPANTIVARFPIVWLPGFLVPLAYGLHLLSLRQLTSNK